MPASACTRSVPGCAEQSLPQADNYVLLKLAAQTNTGSSSMSFLLLSACSILTCCLSFVTLAIGFCFGVSLTALYFLLASDLLYYGIPSLVTTHF